MTRGMTRVWWAQIKAVIGYLYDKGYGPTNLTLKQYLNGLFPEADLPVPGPAELPLDGELPVEAAHVAVGRR